MTIKQKTITIDLEGSCKIVVRRMTWNAARQFLKLLGDTMAAKGLKEEAVTLSQMESFIVSGDTLSECLVLNSTDLSADGWGKLDVCQALAVIDAALELNAGEDLKNFCAGIAAKVGLRVPALMKMTSGAVSTPTSSMPDTQPITSIAAHSGT